MKDQSLQFPITHGPAVLSNALRFVGPGILRVTPAGIELIGQHPLTSLECSLRRMREKTRAIPRAELVEVTRTGAALTLLMQTAKGKETRGVVTAHTPDMAAAMLAAIRANDGESATFAVDFTSQDARWWKNGRGRVMVTPDAVQLENYYGHEQERDVVIVAGVTAKTFIRWLPIAIAALVIILLVTSMLASGRLLTTLGSWYAVILISLIAGTATLAAILAAAFRLRRTATLRKCEIADLHGDGHTVAFTGTPVSVDHAWPESFRIQTETAEQAARLHHALTTYEAHAEMTAWYGPWPAARLALAGKGTMAIKEETVILHGQQQGVGIGSRRTFPAAAISEVGRDGCQVRFSVQTIRGPQCVVVHTKRVAEAEEIVRALGEASPATV